MQSPDGFAIFSFRPNGITVSEASVAAGSAGVSFRLYAESSGMFTAGSIQSGLAIANGSSSPATVMLELAALDGSAVGAPAVITLPANGQVAMFLNQVPAFASLITPFQGALRVSSGSTISVTGLRCRYNERNEFLITTTPASSDVIAGPDRSLFFPHVVDSEGFTTQFILLSHDPRLTTSTSVELFSASGTPVHVLLAN